MPKLEPQIKTFNYRQIKIKSINIPPENFKKHKSFFYLSFNFLYLVGMFVFKVLYFLGWPIFKSLAFFKNILLKDLNSTHKNYHFRKNLILNLNFLKTLIIFILLAIISTSGFFALRLIASALNYKNQITNNAIVGKDFLLQAKDSLKTQNWQEAQNNFLKAYNSFSQGQDLINKAKISLLSLSDLLPEAQDANKLLQSAKLISQAGAKAIIFYNNFKEVRFDTAGLTSIRSNSQSWNESLLELKSIAQLTQNANSLLSQVNPKILSPSQQTQFEDLKIQVKLLSDTFENLYDLFSLVNGLIFGDKKILVLFENNNELRAGGGFIGTFGFFTMQDGRIQSQKISSIYDLDGQLQEKIMPPRPIQNVNDRWFMRDANWFADFPTSANKLSSFFEKEAGVTPDAVIVVTPSLISDLLKITGPIEMEKYGLVLDSDNFVELTQISSSQPKFATLNDPKQILADFAPIILSKLQSNQKLWPQIFSSIQENLTKKQIALYSRFSETEDLIKKFAWDGSLLENDRDFLSLNVSNLGGTKTDYFISQKLNVEVNIAEDGSVVNNLELTRTNKMPKLENSFNLSYLRFYVPGGSILLSDEGFNYQNPEIKNPSTSYKIDQTVNAIEKSAVKSVTTGTVIGEESGKTFFANWLNLEGGQSQTIKISYKLPFNLESVDHYSLLLQKQLGALTIPVSLTINFSGRELVFKNFNQGDVQINQLKTNIDLEQDQLFGVILKNND